MESSPSPMMNLVLGWQQIKLLAEVGGLDRYQRSPGLDDKHRIRKR